VHRNAKKVIDTHQGYGSQIRSHIFVDAITVGQYNPVYNANQ